jgi:uncharacterized protein (TIGR00297 family)
MDSDLSYLIVLLVALAPLVIAMELMARRGWLAQWVSRKILHIIAVGICAVTPLFLESLTWLKWIVLGAELILLFLVATGRLFSEAGGRRSWGIALFPIAYLALLWLFPDQRLLIVLPMGLLAISDAVAALVGQTLARRYYELTGDRKSLVGNTAFFLSGSTLLWLGWMGLTDATFQDFSILPWLLFVALFSTLFEALGSNGWDNIWIPMGSALLLWLGIQAPPPLFLTVVSTLAGLLFIGITVRRSLLTLGGAWLAALLGVWVTIFSGPIWLGPLFLFFFSSALLGKVFPAKSQYSDEKQGKARDHVQVLSNGALYGLFATLYPWQPEIAQTGMLLSMAIATADTWSSELGVFFRGKTYDLLRWKPLPPGLSGGVSWQGTLAGGAGALLIASCTIWISGEQMRINWILIAGVGFVGMLADSLLGAALQAKYAHPATSEWQDRPVQDEKPVAGYSWMTNDRVNWVANGLTTLLALSLL